VYRMDKPQSRRACAERSGVEMASARRPRHRAALTEPSSTPANPRGRVRRRKMCVVRSRNANGPRARIRSRRMTDPTCVSGRVARVSVRVLAERVVPEQRPVPLAVLEAHAPRASRGQGRARGGRRRTRTRPLLRTKRRPTTAPDDDPGVRRARVAQQHADPSRRGRRSGHRPSRSSSRRLVAPRARAGR